MAEKLPYDYTRMALDDAQKKIAALESRWEKLKAKAEFNLMTDPRAADVCLGWIAEIEKEDQ